MPRSRPPHVDAFRDRHGKLRFYFRRGKGPRIPLPGSIGSDEFEAAYSAALAGQVAAKRKRLEPVQDGTIAALIVSYKRSAAFVELRKTSQPGYISRLDAIRRDHGHRTVKGLTRERIVTKILQPYAGQPGAALDTLKKLRILIRHAIELEWLKHDPSLGIKRPRSDEIRSWTDAEIGQFEARWPVGSKQRLAFALMLYTGQRRSDVHRMTWGDANGSTIRVVQQKTKAKLTIPLHSELRGILVATERKHLVIVATEYGKPFTVDGFGQFMRDAITAAGLPLACQPHGLRKAAGRRLAEAGCSARQIMAVLGHKTLAEAERYTRDAEQAGLAAAAIARQEAHTANRVTQTAPSQFGEIAKSEGETE